MPSRLSLVVPPLVQLGRVRAAAHTAHGTAGRHPAGGILPRRSRLPRQGELIGGEVDLAAVWQPVPIMVPNLDPVDVHLAEDQATAEKVLDNQSRHLGCASWAALSLPAERSPKEALENEMATRWSTLERQRTRVDSADRGQ
jgi:hypothetical protein